MKLFTLAALVSAAMVQAQRLAQRQAQAQCDKIIDGSCIFSDEATTVDAVFGDEFGDSFCGGGRNVMGDIGAPDPFSFGGESSSTACPNFDAILAAACPLIGDDLLYVEHDSSSVYGVRNDNGDDIFTIKFGTSELGTVSASSCLGLPVGYEVDMTFVAFSWRTLPLERYTTPPGSFLLRCNGDGTAPTVYAVERSVGAATGPDQLSLPERLAFLATVREGLVTELGLPFDYSVTNSIPQDTDRVIVGRRTNTNTGNTFVVYDDFDGGSSPGYLDARTFTAEEPGFFCYLGFVGGVHHPSVCLKLDTDDEALCTRSDLSQKTGKLKTFYGDNRYFVVDGVLYGGTGIHANFAGVSNQANNAKNFCVFVTASEQVKALNTDVAVGCASALPTLNDEEASTFADSVQVASLFKADMTIRVGGTANDFQGLPPNTGLNVFRTGNGAGESIRNGFDTGNNYPRLDLLPTDDETRASARLTYKTGDDSYYTCKAETIAFGANGASATISLSIEARADGVFFSGFGLDGEVRCVGESAYELMALPDGDSAQPIQLPAFGAIYPGIIYTAFDIKYFRPTTAAPPASPSTTPTELPSASPTRAATPALSASPRRLRRSAKTAP